MIIPIPITVVKASTVAVVFYAASDPAVSIEAVSFSMLRVVVIVLAVTAATWKVSALFNRIMEEMRSSKKDREKLHDEMTAIRKMLRGLPCGKCDIEETDTKE